jgi:hypothetical protein
MLTWSNAIRKTETTEAPAGSMNLEPWGYSISLMLCSSFSFRGVRLAPIVFASACCEATDSVEVRVATDVSESFSGCVMMQGSFRRRRRCCMLVRLLSSCGSRIDHRKRHRAQLNASESSVVQLAARYDKQYQLPLHLKQALPLYTRFTIAVSMRFQVPVVASKSSIMSMRSGCVDFIDRKGAIGNM